MARVLLSHAAEDRLKVRRLADGLRRAGYQPWLIEDELGMGGALPEVIERGLRDSAFVVGCLSHEAVSRGWLQGELRLIIERLPQEGGPRLLLVRFEEVAVPEALQKWSCLDIFDARWDDGVAQLVGFLGADAGGPGDDARLFQALASVSPGALRVMLAAAVFAPGPIPTDWLVATAGLQHDEPEARTLLDELASVELLQAANEGRGVTPAPLAVGRLRAGLAPEMAEKLRVAALAAMASRVTLHQSQSSDEKTKDAEARLFQAESLLRTTSASLELFLWCGLALLIGTRMLRHQRVQPGRELLEEALALAEASEPGQGLQPVALGCLLSLARLARVQDESAHAKQFLDRAGRIAWALPEDARAGALSDVLVELTHLERDPVAAAQAAQRALDLIQQSPSASPELKAHRMLVLAICTRDLGVMDTARSLLEQALKLLEEAGLAETPEAARVYAGLASVLLQSGDTAQAGTLLERALSIEQRTLRDSNPRMAIRLSSLAEVRLAEGRLAEAKALFTQARDMMESRYGPNYKDLGSTLHNLGLTLRRLGEVEEARAAYERAIRILERVHGPDHPYVASSRAGLAQTLEPGSAEATREFERVLSTGLTLYLPRQEAGAELLERALVLARSRKAPPAEVTHALSEALRAADDGGSIENAMRASLLLGATLGNQGAWESAQVHIERGLRLARQLNDEILIAEAYRLLGDANLHGSYYEDARLNYMEAIRRYDGLDFRLKAAKTRLLLLIMLMQLGRIGDVKPLLPPLRQALADGVLTDAQERADTEQALRMAEALLQAPPKVDTP